MEYDIPNEYKGGESVKINTAKIEVFLAERGMTSSELAVAAGICRQSISTIVRRGTCSPKTAGRLAAGLGVTVNEIAQAG